MDVLDKKILKMNSKLRKAKDDLTNDRLLISNDWNAFYRKVALDLKDAEIILKLDEQYRITPRSFQESNLFHF